MSDYTRNIPGNESESVSEAQADQVIAGVRAYLDREGISQSELARKAGVAASTLSMFLANQYAGDWQGMALDLDWFLEREAQRRQADRLDGFVETRLAREILGAGLMVLQRGGIALIHGDSGVGKTTALRHLARITPGCVFVSASTAMARPKGMLMAIGEALHCHVDMRSTADTFSRTMDGLKRYQLLICDEIHKYCGHDDCFDVLRDLHDHTQVPQLWSGSTDLIRYFSRKLSQGGREPLAQIRSRILVARDLNDLTMADGGCFTTAEVRKLLAQGRRKLDPAAVRYLVQLANLKNEGGLRLVKNLYITAATLAAAAKAPLTTLELLHSAHGYQASRRTRQLVETKLAEEEQETRNSATVEARRIAV